MPSVSSLPDDTKKFLHRTALTQQREGRVPGLAAAVSRGGELLWFAGIGTSEAGTKRTPGPDDQYLIASNTKTFTAVMVMQLRDEGRLSLDDLLGDHLPDVPHAVTVRQALAHVSGMQREPLGDIWDTLDQPDAVSLMRGFAEAERVGRPHTRWHYSNLAYAVLGQVVEKLEGRPWFESLQARLLRPLEMSRTTVGFVDDDHVTGYFVPPFHDVPRPEPVLEMKAMSAVGGLASTARDLARWSAFVAAAGRGDPLPRHHRGDVPAPGAHRRRPLDDGHGARVLRAPLGLGPDLGRPRRRDARSQHGAADPP